MVEAALIANYLRNIQPPPVRSKLLHDETLGGRFGLIPRRIITLGGEIHFDQQKLFASVRRALIDQQTVSLLDV
jgi:hypothetical protein